VLLQGFQALYGFVDSFIFKLKPGFKQQQCWFSREQPFEGLIDDVFSLGGFPRIHQGLGIATAVINIRGLVPGRFMLSQTGTGVQRFFYTSNRPLTGNTTGELRQQFDDKIGKTAYQRHEYKNHNPVTAATGLENVDDQCQLYYPDQDGR